MYVSIHMYVCTYVQMYTCIYVIYMYKRIHVHIYGYMYKYKHLSLLRSVLTGNVNTQISDMMARQIAREEERERVYFCSRRFPPPFFFRHDGAPDCVRGVCARPTQHCF